MPMAMGAAWKLRRIAENVSHVLAIELICAAQAIDFRAPLAPARRVGEAHAIVRRLVEPLAHDRVLATDFAAVRAAIGAGRFDDLTPGLDA